MSLVGNLQDLGLGEILQIVSLSRKSGTLALRSEGRTGSIVFRQGLVVRASSSNYKLNLGTILRQKALIDQDTLDRALARQRENGFSERLGSILIHGFGMSREVIEEVVCEQIESIVFSMFEWCTGSFDFVVLDYVESLDGIRMDPLQFMLEQGLNPQFLALEGSRIQDERSQSEKSSASVEAAVEPPLPKTVRDKSAVGQQDRVGTERLFVVVDDDAPTLAAVAEGLQQLGAKVETTLRSEDAIIMLDSLIRAGKFPVLLVDLIMPKMDGSGVLGGVELLELLHNNFKDLPILVMSDYHFEEAEARVEQLGYRVIMKPRRAQIADAAAVQHFMDNLVAAIEEHVKRDFWGQTEIPPVQAAVPEQPVDPVEAEQADAGLTEEELSRLNGMLDDFDSNDPQGGILLLALRFATEFFGRAIVFMVQNNTITGVGQYGISGGKYRGDEIVRSIRIPVESDSMFLGPCKSGLCHCGRVVPTVADRLMLEQLGGGIPDEAFIGPIVSKSRVIGFLYGDNLPDRKPIGNTRILETFLSHVGITMEKNLLERLLNESGHK